MDDIGTKNKIDRDIILVVEILTYETDDLLSMACLRLIFLLLERPQIFLLEAPQNSSVG